MKDMFDWFIIRSIIIFQHLSNQNHAMSAPLPEGSSHTALLLGGKITMATSTNLDIVLRNINRFKGKDSTLILWIYHMFLINRSGSIYFFRLPHGNSQLSGPLVGIRAISVDEGQDGLSTGKSHGRSLKNPQTIWDIINHFHHFSGVRVFAIAAKTCQRIWWHVKICQYAKGDQ